VLLFDNMKFSPFRLALTGIVFAIFCMLTPLSKGTNEPKVMDLVSVMWGGISLTFFGLAFSVKDE